MIDSSIVAVLSICMLCVNTVVYVLSVNRLAEAVSAVAPNDARRYRHSFFQLGDTKEASDLEINLHSGGYKSIPDPRVQSLGDKARFHLRLNGLFMALALATSWWAW